MLSLILKSAVKAKKLAASPIDDVQTKPRAKTKKIEVLSEAELAALLAHLKSGPLYLPALLSANTGLRRGEVCGLRWCDLDLAKGTLHVAQQVQNIGGELVTLVPKTDRSRRTIRVPVTVISALKEHRKARAELRLQLGLGKDTLDLVFADALGRRLDPDAFSKNFARRSRCNKACHVPHIATHAYHSPVAGWRAGACRFGSGRTLQPNDHAKYLRPSVRRR